jgi:hypothetical protein
MPRGNNILARRVPMKKWIVLLLVLGLAFAGCAKKAEESAPEEAAKEAVESVKEAAPEEAAKVEAEDPDVKSCLALVSEAKFAEALPVCLEALEKHPANEEVKAAVAKAQAEVGGEVDATVGKTAGAMEEAAGSLPQ